MIKFEKYVYERPDIDKIKGQFNELLKKFDRANSFETQNDIMAKINELRNEFETMESLVHIRHTLDTRDESYDRENDYIDEVAPIYEGLINQYYKSLVNSKFKSKLKEKWGKQIFTIAQLKIDTFSDEIIEDLQRENKLVSKYTKLRTSAKIDFEGEERNIPQMVPFMESKNRDRRIKAQKSLTEFFKKNEKEFDSIYDQLVKVRHKIAKKLGYQNFIELGYKRLSRSDYNSEKVKNFRQQVLKDIVPIASELRERQRSRLKIKDLKYYDEPLQFLTGNATPKGDHQWIMENGKKMYTELSNEANEFFTYMLEKNLLDVLAKEGKAGGGYCTFINKYKSPFIFSNFNGTSEDIDVLTHEAGHAFQVYLSRNYDLPEYIWPTLDACEIHSMSMEFFAWPWMENFFKEDVEKYKFAHLSGALLFIPYGVLVDEFQHWVYENPEATPEKRKMMWRNLEKKYLPHRDYEDNKFLDRGGYWFRQGHIFGNPFYYIDYTLAQICAFEFWFKSRENREKAWGSYLNLCKAGGSKSFLELVELANLKNPFEDGTIKRIVTPIKNWLETIDDTKL